MKLDPSLHSIAGVSFIYVSVEGAPTRPYGSDGNAEAPFGSVCTRVGLQTVWHQTPDTEDKQGLFRENLTLMQLPTENGWFSEVEKSGKVGRN